MVKGSCICNGIVFQFEGDNFDVIQCHCSKCRKITGSTADAMIVVPKETFNWVQETESITTYKSEDGLARSFCSNCGGSLPNQDGDVYWVPAGTINTEYSASVKAHIYVGSKLHWEEIGGDAPQYDEDIIK